MYSFAHCILNKVKHLWDTLRGHKLAETKELEILLKETIKLYNKAIAQKGKGETFDVSVNKTELLKKYAAKIYKNSPFLFKTRRDCLCLNGFYVDKVGVSALAVRRSTCNDNSVAFLYQTALFGDLFGEIKENINRRVFFRHSGQNAPA